ncbi:hypothetical protein SRHO_G00025680 [Serrasalmus rhombeus]
MSSRKETVNHPHIEVNARPSRHSRVPRYLDDYILDYNQPKHALSSHSTDGESEEQRGAAAAVTGSQAGMTPHQGGRSVAQSHKTTDLLNVESLRELLDSISNSQREETAQLAQLTTTLNQYEQRKFRRQKLMAHITSFLMSEEADDDQPSALGAPHMQTESPIMLPNTRPSSTSSLQSDHPSSPGNEIHSMEHSNRRQDTEHSEVRVLTPTAGERQPKFNSAFKPIQSAPANPLQSLYSSISSGMITSGSPFQQVDVRPESPGLQPHKPHYAYEDSNPTVQPQVQQLLMAPALFKRCYSVPSYDPPGPHLQPPPATSCAPFPRTSDRPQFYASARGDTTFMSYPAQAPSTIAPPDRYTAQQPLYSVPKPKIPDFCSDSEKDFANLKLALDNLLEPHPELSEKYKYHILLEHLKLPEAQMIGQSCRHHQYPYSATMHALQLQYGQPHQLAQSEIAAILTTPDVKTNDAPSFQSFALRVHLLVSMLISLEGPHGTEINCCSHVDRLLSKLPKYLRDGFVEFLQLHGKLNSASLNPYNLQDFDGWLHLKTQQQRLSSRMVQRYQQERFLVSGKEKTMLKSRGQSTAVYHGTEPTSTQLKTKKQPSVHCLFCDSKEHYISRCSRIKDLSLGELTKWIKQGNRCWKCARSHPPDTCNLKKPCSDCGGIHLQVLHGLAQSHLSNHHSDTSESRVYLTPSVASLKVLLKVVPVLLHNKSKTIETFAILDDGAQRTMILPAAVQQLQLEGKRETLALRTVRSDITNLAGSKVTFQISPRNNPRKRFRVQGAFTASGLDLMEQSYPVQTLQKRYAHLRGIPLQSFHNARPLVLIGSDNVHLITATEPVRRGHQSGPIAIRTALGWALQGTESCVRDQSSVHQCLLLSTANADDLLYRQVERLWQLDVLPYRNEKLVVRSREDQEAIKLLEDKTKRVSINGVLHYATPLLWKSGTPKLNGSIQSVMANLRSTERRLKRDYERELTYRAEINKLVQAGYISKLQPDQVQESEEQWYLPHHLVHHNSKPRLVFNCSFRHQGISLNEQLLPGPVLGPSLLGVLLRFRQHCIAVSGDIRGMFHQVRLKAEDRPFLRFVWRDMRCEDPPDVYQWEVLPFGTTSSPCCAIFALQQHTHNHQGSYSGTLQSVQQCFYVDNYLESFPTIAAAKERVDKLRNLLLEGGFDLRQWASNQPTVIAHLPTEAKSLTTEQWLGRNQAGPMEPTLGLRWNCTADTLGYQHRPIEHSTLTMRRAYQVLASQYDPLGFIVPFTTRAKVLIQQLWSKQKEWDDPDLPPVLKEAWENWENELQQLGAVSIPRCYSTDATKEDGLEYDLHVFCDASEKAYGAVAYLAVHGGETIHTSFVMARSRVAPKRQQSIPRLELCAALAGAQLARLVHAEVTLTIRQTVLWSDSMTVLEWLQSDSCRFKVFVGTRVSEIQELTDRNAWRYVDTHNNPADDITRGKPLLTLVQPSRWSQGPSFLKQSMEHWPKKPESATPESLTEVKGVTLCCLTVLGRNNVSPDATGFRTWKELVEATQKACHGATAESLSTNDQPVSYQDAELLILRECQTQSFPDEVAALREKKPVPNHSRLSNLAPEWDTAMNIIRVGGRLRRLQTLNMDEVHPIVLHPRHPATQLLIKDFDERLLHPGTERVYAEVRRQYWILRGRQAIRHHQLHCRWGAIFKYRELRAAFAALHPQLQAQLADYQILFKFNPPSAPHFGGTWEREVRSIKSALRVAVGSQSTSEDVLYTVLVEVEGILNSKPLCYASSDVADPDPITPNMLLMGRRDASLPQVAYAPADMGRRRWRHCQNIVDQFWIQFARQYLPTLQTRQKWHKQSENLAVDSVVMIVDPQLPRAQWPIGRVTKTITSQDGCVRIVDVLVKGKIYTRPVARLIQLPRLTDGSNDL